jgi:uncharacterized sulfatase
LKNQTTPFLSKIVAFCKSYIELCIWLLVFAIGIRVFEAILLWQGGYAFWSTILWNLIGLCYDISLFLRISICILILFVVISGVNEKTTRIILRVLLSLMLFFSLICILFFITSGYLLDKVVYNYSIKEIWFIIQSSSKQPVWVYIIVIALPILYFFTSNKRIKISNLFLVAYTILTLSSFFVLKKLPFSAKYYHIKVNKEYFFFWKTIFSAFTENKITINDENISEIVKEFRDYFKDHQFVEMEYPFLYQQNDKDVLSPFFNLKPEPPNFVFIIIESWGYEFFKNYSETMPFLDSLSKESLTWENCLCASSRTFGVLPALYGLSPLGEKGFLDQCPNNSEYQSFLRILHNNNYTNNFFYGGDISFDNMKYFADDNYMSYLKNNDWDKDIIEETIKPNWGYEDHLLYRQAIRKLNQIKTSPRVDVYLSLSTHEPWEYPNDSYFKKIVFNKISSKKQKEDFFDWLSGYGCFAYSDWSIQQLIEGYKKRDDFDNTIFIITGDHPTFSKQFGGYSNYHVPLIIYSPMLKSGRNMKGVVSHRDITPTLLSLLQKNYNIETPKEVTWLNTALDTSLVFNANTFSPLQLIDHTIGGILFNKYILCENILEEISDGASCSINNLNVLRKMNRFLSLYQSLDLYILDNDALIKNDYAYRNKSAYTILDIDDTIAQGSYFAELEILPVVEGPEGHKTTLYFDNSNKYPIRFLHFNAPNNIDGFTFDIEFKIYIKNNDDNDLYICLVADLFELSYKSEWFNYEKQNRWITYKNSLTYKKEMWQHNKKTPYLKVYIWNNGNLEAYIDDIKVKLKIISDEK